MKFSKQEIALICNNYNLGNFVSAKQIKQGLVNFNYIIKTDTGEYILRGIGKELDKDFLERLNLQFKVLKYLKDKKFPYKIPNPLINKKGEELMNINGKNLWVYEKIHGTCSRKTSPSILKELGKAIAQYHKCIKDFRITKSREIFGTEWIIKEFDKIKKMIPKNELDRLMKENISIFEGILHNFMDKKIDKNLLITHSDFNLGNVVFDKGKIAGIIDFENIQIAPRIYDLSQAIKFNCTKTRISKESSNIILNEYEKIIPLSKEEKDGIVDLMLFGSCCEVAWMYGFMKKNQSKKKQEIENEIKLVKNMLKSNNHQEGKSFF